MHDTKYTCWPTALLTPRLKSLWGKGKATSAQKRTQVRVNHKLMRKQNVKVGANNPTVHTPLHSLPRLPRLCAHRTEKETRVLAITTPGFSKATSKSHELSVVTHPKHQLRLQKKKVAQRAWPNGVRHYSAMAHGLGKYRQQKNVEKYELCYKI